MPKRLDESIVAIARHPMEGEGILQALSHLPEELVKEGETVVITPNWTTTARPESGVVVGPESLRQLLRWFWSKRVGRLIVATGSGGKPTPQVMKEVGYDRILQEESVEFIDLNEGPFIDLQLDHDSPSSTPVHEILIQTDLLVSYAQIKVHEAATVTLGIKNVAMGWPPASVHGYPKTNLGIHVDLHGFIRAMAEKIPIGLTILSGDKGMVGRGPTKGRVVDSDIVIAGTDPVATDVVGARLLGFMPQAVGYLFELARRGVGKGNLQEVEFRGVPLVEAEAEFTRTAYGLPLILDEDGVLPLHM